MSNIAGKAYAMNVVTPIKWYMRWINKFIFWFVNSGLLKFIGASLDGLTTLSLIHYARWAIVKPNEFPRLNSNQPLEDIKYSYMFFFSNFNGSWEQYVDSFHTAIPTGLDLFWFRNVKYPKSVPLQPFHEYITYNQVWTNHYYNAYPCATSNDVKSAKKIKTELIAFTKTNDNINESPEDFQKRYNKLLLSLQNDISIMQTTPIVSLSANAVQKRHAATHKEQAHGQ